MMPVKRFGLVVALAACGAPPPFELRFRLTHGAEESCPSDKGTGPAASCADVTMLCAGVVSIRILDPSDPTAPYISVCKLLVGKQDLCSIAGVDLPQPTHPILEQKLEVQMAVYPLSALAKDANNQPICPTDVQFTATGFPEPLMPPCDDPTSCPIVPAVGGRAFYHPGDTETVVDLGCSDLGQLKDPTTCGGHNQVAITATVNDFDSDVSVDPATADTLSVAVGEPTAVGTEYVLNASGSRPLARTVVQPVPGWGAQVDLGFTNAACLAVLEQVAQSTPTVKCKPITTPGQPAIDLSGIRLAKPSLDQLLVTLGQAEFPATGLVVGIVLDYLGNPAPSYIVTTSDPSAHVQYLSADRRGIVVGGTSTSGIFVSRDAPFGTIFSVHDSSFHVFTGYGGLVANKVTVVVLQLDKPVGN